MYLSESPMTFMRCLFFYSDLMSFRIALSGQGLELAPAILEVRVPTTGSYFGLSIRILSNFASFPVGWYNVSLAFE